MNIRAILGIINKTKGLGTEITVSAKKAESLLAQSGKEGRTAKKILSRIAEKHPNAIFRVKVNNSEQGLQTLGITMVDGPTTLGKGKVFVSGLGTENSAVRAAYDLNVGKGSIRYRGYSRGYQANKNSDYLYSLTRQGDVTRYEGKLDVAEHAIIEMKGNTEHPITELLAKSHSYGSDLLAGKDVQAPGEFLKSMFAKGKKAERATEQVKYAQAKDFDAGKFKEAFKKAKVNDNASKRVFSEEDIEKLKNMKEAKMPNIEEFLKKWNA